MMEVVVAIALMAVVLPTGYAAFARAHDSGFRMRAEELATWVIPACIDEFQVSSGHVSGEEGGFLAGYAYSSEGRLLGQVDEYQYRQGILRLDGQRVGWLGCVRLPDERINTIDAGAVRWLVVSLEYPSGVAAGERKRVDCHLRLP